LTLVTAYFAHLREHFHARQFAKHRNINLGTPTGLAKLAGNGAAF
jgi:hypothetical protein